MVKYVGNPASHIGRYGAVDKYPYTTAGYRPQLPKKTMADKLRQKITPQIPYQRAKYRKEAVEFSNQLGIKEVNIRDLNLINFINEGLVEFMRQSGKNIPQIDIITDTPLPCSMPENLMATGVIDGKRYVYVHPTYFTQPSSRSFFSSNEQFAEVLSSPYIELADNQKNILNMALRYPQHLTENEKDIADQIVESYEDAKNSMSFYYLGLLNNKHTWQIAKKIGIKLLNNKEFASLSHKDADEYLTYLEQNGCKAKIENKTKFFALFHELGHIEHRNIIGNAAYESMKIKRNPNFTEKSVYDYPSTQEFARYDGDHWMTRCVSNYAMTCPVEFIADTYASMVAGAEFCPELKDMYDRYSGPKMTMRKRIMDALKK